MDLNVLAFPKKKSHKITEFIKKNIVCIIAITLALSSCFFIPPDAKYLDYFDVRTLVSLFSMLAVICALRNIDFFKLLAKKIIKIFKTTRSAITALIFITFISSMLIANDMALITFLPLGFIMLSSCDKNNYMLFCFIMQTVAANLGGMLTPFGNPQNLYLYNYFQIPTLEFFSIMYIPFVCSVILIFSCCLFIKKEPMIFEDRTAQKFNTKLSLIYFVLFVYTIVIVFRIVPYWTGLLIVPILLILDRKALRDVDYMLLLTFTAFFVFSGNLSRITSIQNFISMMLNKNVLISAILSCQFISNVPTAILLAGFTQNYSQLLIAVNLGGLGTLIASLASLITFKEFARLQPKNIVKYLIFYHTINFSFLVILILVSIFAI